jgi:cell division protein FtsZ
MLQHTADDVTIRPLAPKPSLFMEPQLVEPASHDMPKAFIPPQPERPANRGAPRMPRIEELPIPAQNEIRAQRGEIGEENPEKRRMSLLQRLAAVGLGRRDGEGATPAEPPRAPNQQVADRLPQRGPSRPPEPVSEYARRGSSPAAPQGLDLHGRSAPVHKAVDDDQLDIPAFLRRQAN